MVVDSYGDSPYSIGDTSTAFNNINDECWSIVHFGIKSYSYSANKVIAERLERLNKSQNLINDLLKDLE